MVNLIELDVADSESSIEDGNRSRLLIRDYGRFTSGNDDQIVREDSLSTQETREEPFHGYSHNESTWVGISGGVSLGRLKDQVDSFILLRRLDLQAPRTWKTNDLLLLAMVELHHCLFSTRGVNNHRQDWLPILIPIQRGIHLLSVQTLNDSK